MSGAPATAALPPARPRFRPQLRWARWALVFLLAFTLLRGVIWSVTFPSFFGPDEDYHFLYIEYLTTQHKLPSPDRKLYPLEYQLGTDLENYNSYGGGVRPDFVGDPHASVRMVGNLPPSARQPTIEGRGVGVVHPPLYHFLGFLVNRSLGNASFFTRYDAVKWMTSVIGVLAVYAAWLLAAQVFRREGPRLLVAFMVAVQPMVALLSGIVNHDELLIALFTLSLALMLFVVRTPPRARQGLWLGAAITLALLVKGSALVLLPLAAVAYLGQGLAFRGSWREVARSAGLAAGIVVVFAGWWYVRSEALYGSLAGYAPIPPGHGHHPAPSIGQLWAWTKMWMGLTYKTYWWHHFWYEAPRTSTLYYVPGYLGVVGMLGLGRCAFRARRELRSPDRPLLRQAILMTLAALALLVPILAADLQHFANGSGFSLAGGRYLLPGYAGVAALLVIGLRELVRERAQPVVLTAVAVLAGWFCWRTWNVNYLHRYYGTSHDGWTVLFTHMSFDRPEFVTATSLKVVFVLVFLTLGAFVLSVAAGSLPPPVAARLARLRLRGGGAAPLARPTGH